MRSHSETLLCQLIAALREIAGQLLTEVRGTLAPVEPFSRRHRYVPRAAEITIREDAPSGLRATLMDAAGQHLTPKGFRSIVCRAIHELPDRSNWSDGNVWEEAQRRVEEADWPYIYDIIEMVFWRLAELNPDAAMDFGAQINDHFLEAGIGWQLIDGRIETRGTEAFEATVRGAETALAEAGLPTASREIREALQDLSKRPEPDLTGAIHHGIGALECVAREACGDANLTLGGVIKHHPRLFPSTLLTAVEKAWGYASETGRHIRESSNPDRADVEFVVGLAATVATYLAAKIKPTP